MSITHIIQQWGPILVGVLAVVSIVTGAHLALRPVSNLQMGTRLARIFAFGSGTFFTAVCLDFLPDAWSGNGDNASYWLFVGALAMWLATHLSDILFDGGQSASSTSEWQKDVPLTFNRVSAIVLAAALSFHTFFEGAAVTFSFHELTTATWGFSLAMILHKLPEGVLWGLALSAVFPKDVTKIRQILVIPAVCTLVGVVLGILLANRASTQTLNIVVAIVGGAMLYIAFAELLPAVRQTNQPRVTMLWFVFGTIIMFGLNTASDFFGQL